jgi:glyoxylase-like metal-dependent hydrolase (beta-lactamase superfamily II)
MAVTSGIRQTLVLSAALLLSSPVLAEKHGGSSPAFKISQLTDQVSMLKGKGGNVAVLTGKQGILMVDDDYKEMTPALRKALKNFGGEKKLTYIVNTHWHGDHTQGNFHFGHDAQIVAHDNVRERLLTSQEVKLFKMVTEPYPEHALPSITYQKQLTMHMNGEKVSIIHYPGGHTDGDSVIYFNNANVLHTGDLYFNGFFPFVDVQNGGSVKRMAENVSQMLELINDRTLVIPGHGPVSNKAELTEFRDMLRGTYAEVEAMRAKGMNLGQMQVEGLSADWIDWTDGFLSEQLWIGIVNSSIENDK